jgi:outer membrane receptor protein involved in Fe transport
LTSRRLQPQQEHGGACERQSGDPDRQRPDLIDRQTVNRLTVGSPKDKFSLATDWALGDWGTRAVVTRYGSFTVPQNNATLDQTYSPQWVLDLSASVKLGKNWRLTVASTTRPTAIRIRSPRRAT